MGKTIRTFLAMTVLLSLLLLAKGNAAWAAGPALGDHQLDQPQAALSASLDGDEDCEKENNRNKDKCKDKDKDKCKGKHDHDCGTVKPPDDDFDICERGDYSVAGVATLDVKKLQDRQHRDDCFHARSVDSSGVSGLPPNAGTVLSDAITLTSVGQGTTVKICFAAPPGKDVKIYAWGKGGWKPVGTQVKNGMACASVPGSGSYVLAGK